VTNIAMRSNANKQKKTTVEQNVTYIVVEKIIKTGEILYKTIQGTNNK